MNQFTIWARVESTEAGEFTATACALPVDGSVLAEVRTDARDSSQEATQQLVPMARGLAREITSRGDLVLSIELPGTDAQPWEA